MTLTDICLLLGSDVGLLTKNTSALAMTAPRWFSERSRTRLLLLSRGMIKYRARNGSYCNFLPEQVSHVLGPR